MAQQQKISVENNFTGGLKTEFTGLNFPENSATDTDNCVYTLTGDVTRRPGFNFEDHYALSVSNADGIVSTYHWKNAGGDGETQVFVLQVGTTLYFYQSSNATVLAPLSTTILNSTVDLNAFVVPDSILGVGAVECQYADGNGYLFVYHPSLEPFYCSFTNGVITANVINIKIRDFVGVNEPGVTVNNRPSVLTDEHLYNLENQGWTRGALWSTTITAFDNKTDWDFDDAPLSFTGNGYQGAAPKLGHHSWIASPGLPIVTGTPVDINYTTLTNVYDITEIQWSIRNVSGVAKGVILSYDTNNGAITVDITSVNPVILGASFEVSFASTPGGDLNGFVPNYNAPSTYTVTSSNTVDLIDTWYNEVGSYPSNADVWWLYKTVVTTATVNGVITTTIQADTFDPAVTQTTIPVSSTPAPKGHFILDAFNQNQPTVSGIDSITTVKTGVRPRTGAWFQGRVWYAGCDAVQPATGDQNFYTWTENLYFSQIVTDITNFEKCYQTNDPTSETLADLLPNDGGVISIQGCGSIFKLFPIQNGMLVFAANGIWFITGSSGIGFTANDYTITKISEVRSISSTSFVNINGLPYFWNEEAIYEIVPAQQGSGLVVNPITTGTIKSFYDDIPYRSKQIAKGSYDPINYVAQWLYASKEAVIEGHPGSTETIVTTQYNAFDPDYTTGLATLSNNDLTLSSIPRTRLWRVAVDVDNQRFWIWNPFFGCWNDASFTEQNPETGAGGWIPLSSPGYTPGSAIFPTFWINYGPDISNLYPHTQITLNTGATPFIQGIPTGFRSMQDAVGAPVTFDPGSAGYAVILSNGNLTAYANGTDLAMSGLGLRTTSGVPSGKFYYEFTIDAIGTSGTYSHLFISLGSGTLIGLQNTDYPGTNGQYYHIGEGPDPPFGFGLSFQIDGTYPGDAMRTSLAVQGKSTGKYYWEITVDNLLSHLSGTGPRGAVGVASHFQPLCTPSTGGGGSLGFGVDPLQGIGLSDDGGVVHNGSVGGGGTWHTGTTLGIALDLDAKKIWFWNPEVNKWNNSSISSQNPELGLGGFDISSITYPVYPAASVAWWETADIAEDVLTGNWGTSPFVNTPPAGFGPWFETTTTTIVIPGTNSVLDSRTYDKALNLNTFNKAFYPWTISTGEDLPTVHDIKYIQNPGGEGAPDGIFKYVTATNHTDSGADYTFSECSDTSYLDWNYNGAGVNFESYFITGYKLHGQALRQWQPEYVIMYSRNDVPTRYKIQGIWDFANDRNSGKYTSKQLINVRKPLFGMCANKIRIRGNGLSLQLKVDSSDDKPFDIMGWTILENQNANI